LKKRPSVERRRKKKWVNYILKKKEKKRNTLWCGFALKRFPLVVNERRKKEKKQHNMNCVVL
jgi:hypothetical protein